MVPDNSQRVMAPVFKHERIVCESGGCMKRRATNVEGILGAAHLGRGTLEDAAQTASWKPPDEAEGRAPSKKRASIFATRLRPQKSKSRKDCVQVLSSIIMTSLVLRFRKNFSDE